eukprot:2791888-Pleurochrysis_carterae.AAC.2
MANAGTTLRHRQHQLSLRDHEQPQVQQADIEPNNGISANQNGEQMHASGQDRNEDSHHQRSNVTHGEVNDHFDMWLCTLALREWQFHRWTPHLWGPAAAISFIFVIAIACSPADESSPIYSSSVATLAFIAFCLVFVAYAKREWCQKGIWLLVGCFICGRLAYEHLLCTPRRHVSPEALLMGYGMDIMRPVLFMTLVPVMAMPPYVYGPLILVHSCALFRSSLLAVATMQAIVSQTALNFPSRDGFAVESYLEASSLDVSWSQACTCIFVPVAVFVVGIGNASFREKMNRELHKLLQQREQAHRQEEAATRRAAESELRAREAERIAHEQDVQRRNKYAPTIHTFVRHFARMVSLKALYAESLRSACKQLVLLLVSPLHCSASRNLACMRTTHATSLWSSSTGNSRCINRMLTSTRLSRCPGTSAPCATTLALQWRC